MECPDGKFLFHRREVHPVPVVPADADLTKSGTLQPVFLCFIIVGVIVNAMVFREPFPFFSIGIMGIDKEPPLFTERVILVMVLADHEIRTGEEAARLQGIEQDREDPLFFPAVQMVQAEAGGNEIETASGKVIVTEIPFDTGHVVARKSLLAQGQHFR